MRKKYDVLISYWNGREHEPAYVCNLCNRIGTLVNIFDKNISFCLNCIEEMKEEIYRRTREHAAQRVR